MGQARRYILTCDYLRPSGVTTVTGTSTYDMTDAFSGTSIFDVSGASFSYSAITISELGLLADNEYDQRAEDFLSYVSQFEYSFTLSGLTGLLVASQFEEVTCSATTTTTTTTTLPPTTTTTTTPSPTTTTTTTTTLPPTTTTTTTTEAPVPLYFGVAWDDPGVPPPTFSTGSTDGSYCNTCLGDASSGGFKLWFSTTDTFDNVSPDTGGGGNPPTNIPIDIDLSFGDTGIGCIGTNANICIASAGVNGGMSCPISTPYNASIPDSTGVFTISAGTKQGYIAFNAALDTSFSCYGMCVSFDNNGSGLYIQVPPKGTYGCAYGIATSNTLAMSSEWLIERGP